MASAARCKVPRKGNFPVGQGPHKQIRVPDEWVCLSVGRGGFPLALMVTRLTDSSARGSRGAVQSKAREACFPCVRTVTSLGNFSFVLGVEDIWFGGAWESRLWRA